MKDIYYILLIIVLTIFVLYYGGHNFQTKVEYESEYFYNINKIIMFEKKLHKFNQEKNFNEKNFINIEDYVNTSQIIIPNLVDMYFIKVEPNSFFNIENIFSLDKSQHIMIIFNNSTNSNNDRLNNLELILNSDDDSIYLYKLKNKVSITGIYDIYNNSDNFVVFTVFIMKKPFWHK